jgi:hypothetical protein
MVPDAALGTLKIEHGVELDPVRRDTALAVKEIEESDPAIVGLAGQVTG